MYLLQWPANNGRPRALRPLCQGRLHGRIHLDCGVRGRFDRRLERHGRRVIKDGRRTPTRHGVGRRAGSAREIRRTRGHTPIGRTCARRLKREVGADFASPADGGRCPHFLPRRVGAGRCAGATPGDDHPKRTAAGCGCRWHHFIGAAATPSRSSFCGSSWTCRNAHDDGDGCKPRGAELCVKPCFALGKLCTGSCASEK